MRDRGGTQLWLTALLLVLLWTPTSRAEVPIFSEDGINIFLLSEPEGSGRHGYAEYIFRIINTTQSVRRVTLTMPAEDYGGDSILSALSRKAELEPQGNVLLTLYQPSLPQISGQNLRVTIDGRVQKETIPFTIQNITRPEQSSSRRGRSGFQGFMPLVMVGPSIKQEALDELQIELVDPRDLLPRPGAGIPRGGSLVPRIPGQLLGETKQIGPSGRPMLRYRLFEELRPKLLPRDWSNHWLTYSRYDGIILGGEDFRAIPEANRPALWQYVECGGALFIAGDVKVADGWKGVRRDDAVVYQPGFGLCITAATDLTKSKEEIKQLFRTQCGETAIPFRTDRTVIQANDRLPVVDDIGIPVRGLFALMVVFVFLIGPVNFTLMSRWKKRLWLLWTVPAIAGLTVAVVFGYMLIAEGWSRHQRTELIVIKDENTGRATTIGWTAFYSPITPGEGLHFRYDTELTLQGEFDEEDERRYGGRRRGSRNCTMDWTTDQHLDRGWMRARLPVHFLVRKSEKRQERLIVRRNPDGGFSATNAFGVNISQIVFADEAGKMYRGTPLPAGGSQTLQLTDDRLASAPRPWRQLYTLEWLDSSRLVRAEAANHLMPMTYLVELDDSPFLEDGLARTQTRKCSTVVLGILKGLDE